MKETAIKIIKELQFHNFQAVFAGGCVRDMLLKKDPKDYDIATNATSDQIESIFEKTFAIGKAFGVINVLIDDYNFEVATFRNDGEYNDGRRPDSIKFCSMEEDSKRRDLTINGLFYDPIKCKIYDFVKGIVDLNNKIIRFIGDAKERIKEDKLRMIRAIRFAAQLNFNFDIESLKAIKNHAYEIHSVSNERIGEELTKILKTDNPSIAFNNMLKTKILHEILPEIVRLKGCNQSPKWHPEGAIFTCKNFEPLE